MIVKIIIGLCIFVILLGVLLFLFPLCTVHGDSMYPTYKDREHVIATRLFNHKHLKNGKVYVFKSPNGKSAVKRLHHMAYIPVVNNKEPVCYFLGDNPSDSLDSRHYGYVPVSKLELKILFSRPEK